MVALYMGRRTFGYKWPSALPCFAQSVVSLLPCLKSVRLIWAVVVIF